MTSGAGELALVGGVLALDFANTAAGRDTAEPVEHLQSAGDLVDWAAHAGSIDAATAQRCHVALAGDAAAAEQLLRGAAAPRGHPPCRGSDRERQGGARA